MLEKHFFVYKSIRSNKSPELENLNILLNLVKNNIFTYFTVSKEDKKFF
jgi:hypothetical protein